jgi:dienelactone hydrolase
MRLFTSAIQKLISEGCAVTENVEFNSCGDTCKGVLTRPPGKSGDAPLVIMAGGWCYTKEIVMPWYGKYFEDLGCATLRFDYRRFGESTGEPRQHINPWDQIEDYRNALSFAETLPGIDRKRTGIWGISYSGDTRWSRPPWIPDRHSPSPLSRWSMVSKRCAGVMARRGSHS